MLSIPQRQLVLELEEMEGQTFLRLLPLRKHHQLIGPLAGAGVALWPLEPLLTRQAEQGEIMLVPSVVLVLVEAEAVVLEIPDLVAVVLEQQVC